ncbi:S24/S26 family peptidase [Enterococcus hermanniensis]|uniref:Signal peptidase I n=1 Tax=Enterococcus hermanniensis TaxID=249189 RepID=A0A1L8TRV7_9ENTE|nr:S26 family signal peptidase [Enterococcus hermanniensis]OJG46953.1 signal peptidase I [Enterococcus hermanniensis]
MKRKKITIFCSFLIFLIFFLSFVTIVIPSVLKVTPHIVEDDTMAPEYKKNGLIFVKEADQPINVGDTITYYENQGTGIKTRRVLALDNKISGYFVKGDNEEKAEMGMVHERNLIGCPAFYLPYIGFLVNPKMLDVIKILLFILAFLLTLITLMFNPERHKRYLESFKEKDLRL